MADRELSEFTDNGLTDEEQAVMDEIDEKSTDDSSNKVDEDETAKESEDVSEDEPTEEETIEAEAPDDDEQILDKDIIDNESSFLPQFEQSDQILKNIQDELSLIEEEGKNLKEEYENGELSVDNYFEKRENLSDKRTELLTNKVVYENNAKNNEAFQDQLWAHDQKVFFEDKSNEIFLESNPAMFGALDQTIKSLAKNPDYQGKTGAWLLKTAKQKVLDTFKVNDAEISHEEKKDKKVTAPKKEIPLTLADIPAADQNLSEKGEFDYIDQLIEDGNMIGYESELAKMSTEEVDKYLRATEK